MQNKKNTEDSLEDSIICGVVFEFGTRSAKRDAPSRRSGRPLTVTPSRPVGLFSEMPTRNSMLKLRSGEIIHLQAFSIKYPRLCLRRDAMKYEANVHL